MSWIRGFSSQGGGSSDIRNVEDCPTPDAPRLVDLFFSLAEHKSGRIPPEHIYRVTAQSLGIDASGVPYSGYRYATGRDIGKVDWPRIYDLIVRLWPDFDRQGFGHKYEKA